MKKTSALVIGASIAGMMAARVLANHYSRVVILERDAQPDPAADARTTPAKGVPQSDHLHVLLDSGMVAIEHYFPGITADMIAAGAQAITPAAEWRWFQHGSWKVKARDGIVSTTQHRRSLDQHIRKHLMQLPNIQFIYGCTVSGVLWDGPRDNITGVNIVQQSGTPRQLHADLLLDASGKGSRMLDWLYAAPYEASERGVANPPWDKFTPVPVESLPIKLAYVSRIYQKPASLPEWKALAISPLPHLPRGGVLQPIDDRHWIVTLFGYCGEHPLTTHDGFLDFAMTLAVSDLYQAIAHATALTEPVKYQYPHSLRHRLDQATRFPGGVLLIGDAMCSLDPVFGQGMALACKEARLLDCLLQSSSASDRGQKLRKRFFKDCQKLIEPAWFITQAEVLRFEKMPGPRSLKLRLAQWYTGQVFALCSQHADVYLALLDVIHLNAGPSRLMQASILGRVLLRWLGFGK